MKNRKMITALSLATILTFAFSATTLAAPPDMPGGEGGGPGGGSSSDVSWTGATTITTETEETGKNYASTQADENAVLVDTDKTVTLNNAVVTKSGGESASDTYSFYGINSAVMAKGGATLNLSGGTITTDAAGANAVFSYGANSGKTNAVGDGTTVNVSDMTIKTSGNGSGGIMTTYGGTTNASNLTIETSGGSSAPIRTDRGGGWVTVDGGTYTSNGLGSPAIYSTADVKVSNAALVSNLSEGVCIEGTGSIELKDCDLYANNTKTNGKATFYDTIMIYQSMSGDASDGTSSFSMSGGSLTSKSGDTFHVTNTSAVITLEGVHISNSEEGALISVCDDGWSESTGTNAAELNAKDQVLTGAVLVGSDSTLAMTLSGSSVWTGYSSGEITNAKGEAVSDSIGALDVTIESGSQWTLTGDSYVTSLNGSGKINYNGHTLYVGEKAYTSGNIGSVTETDESGASEEITEKAVVFQNTEMSFKKKALKKTKKTFSVIQESGDGAVSVSEYQGKAKKYIKVSADGTVTVKKKTPKGTYHFTVSVEAAGGYASAVEAITVIVK